MAPSEPRAPDPLSESSAHDQRSELSELNERRRLFMRSFHIAMLTLALVVGGLTSLGTLSLDAWATLSTHALMWVTLWLIVRGVEGMLSQRGTLGGALIVQLFVLLVSVPLLVSLFRASLGSLLTGASLWLLALIYVGLNEPRK